MKRTAILGFGNPTRSDDGIGCYVIECLREQLRSHTSYVNYLSECLSDDYAQETHKQSTNTVTLLDMGTSAFEVLFKLYDHERIILVDAVVNSDEPTGTLFCVPADEIASAPQDDPLLFLHGMKWNQALSYAKKILGSKYPSDIQVYLIAIDDTRLGIGLSDAVRAAGNRVVALVLETILEPLTQNDHPQNGLCERIAGST